MAAGKTGRKKIKKSTLVSIVFIAAVLILTLVSVLNGSSPADLLREMASASPVFLVLAVLCVLGYCMLQGVIIYLMCKSLDLHESLWHCMLIAFHGYFMCNITPMQTGGPVIQIYDMKKEGITVPMACMMIFNMTFLFKLVLFAMTIGLVLFGRNLIRIYMWNILPLTVLGILLTLTFTVLIGFLIFNTKLSKKVVLKLFDWAVRHHILKDKPGRREKLVGLLDQYKDAAGFFITHRGLMAVLFGLTFLQRFLFFSATFFVYKSLGLSGTNWWTICILQASINIIADLLPVPGGAGVSEMVFSVIFLKVFGSSVNSGLLLSRGITYYAQLLICGAMSAVAGFTFSLDRTKMGRVRRSYYNPEEANREAADFFGRGESEDEAES